MSISDDLYYAHKINIIEKIREDATLSVLDKTYITKTAKHSGEETTIAGAKKRLEYLIRIMDEYEEENKLQNSRTSNVGFDLS